MTTTSAARNLATVGSAGPFAFPLPDTVTTLTSARAIQSDNMADFPYPAGADTNASRFLVVTCNRSVNRSRCTESTSSLRRNTRTDHHQGRQAESTDVRDRSVGPRTFNRRTRPTPPLQQSSSLYAGLRR